MLPRDQDRPPITPINGRWGVLTHSTPAEGWGVWGGYHLKHIRIMSLKKIGLWWSPFEGYPDSDGTYIKLSRWGWFLSGKSRWRTSGLKRGRRSWRTRWRSRTPWSGRMTPEEWFSCRTWKEQLEMQEHTRKGTFWIRIVWIDITWC